MSLLSSLFKKKDERVLVIDIGSASVSGAFITLRDDVVVVVASATSDIAVLPEVDPARFEAQMQQALDRVLSMLGTTHKRPPEHVSVFLSSLWYMSAVRTARVTKTTPFTVTTKMVEELAAKELKLFEESITKKTPSEGEKLKTIESKIVGVSLNGYSVEDPVGATALSMDLSLFICSAPVVFLERLESRIQKYYAHKTIEFSSFLGAAYHVLHDHVHKKTDYLFVDIGGEVTDVTLVKDGIPVQSVSFPLGRNFMLRALSEGLHRSIAESVSICSLYMEGKVEEGLKQSCQKILQQTKDRWLGSFQEALFSVSNELSLPDTVYLTSHEDVAPWFMEVIRREEFHQYTLTEKEFRVTLLDTAFFNDMLLHADGALRNPFVMIEALVSGHYHWYKKTHS